MGRAPCCDKANVKRGPWSPEEDAALRSYVEQNGIGGNWIALPQKAGLRRCGKSCRLRWLNYLRPDIKHGGFTEEEDNVIYTLFKNIGSRWSVIASHMPGRTDNDVKNYWNTKLKKRLLAAAASSSSSSNNQTPSPSAPLVPSIKAEDYSSASFDWPSVGGFGAQDSYRFFSPELPPLPMPAATTAQQAEDNWPSSCRGDDDLFLSELGFDSYSELLFASYGEVAPPSSLLQRITYS